MSNVCDEILWLCEKKKILLGRIYKATKYIEPDIFKNDYIRITKVGSKNAEGVVMSDYAIGLDTLGVKVNFQKTSQFFKNFKLQTGGRTLADALNHLKKSKFFDAPDPSTRKMVDKIKILIKKYGKNFPVPRFDREMPDKKEFAGFGLIFLQK